MAQADARLSHLLGRRAVPAIAGLVALCVLFMAGLLFKIAREQDARVAVRAEQLVSAAMTRQRDAIARSVKDYAAWGEAYQHLHVRTDVDWAYGQQNLGPTLYKDLSIDELLVIGPAGTITYAVIGGAYVPAPAPSLLNPDLLVLAERARGAEPSDLKPAAGYIQDPNGPMLASAMVITTGGDPTIVQVPGPASVLVFADALTPARLTEIGREGFVQDLRLADGTSHHKGDPSVSLTSADGTGTIALRWDQERPGRALLAGVLPWLALAGAAFALLTALVLRRAVAAARLIEISTTALTEAHRLAEFSSLHDPVTLLPNRLMLRRYLGRCFAIDGAPKPVALLFIDLDRFKPINDGFGHEVGDDVLKETAARLQRLAGVSSLVARVGGDEFVLGVPIVTTTPEIEGLCASLIASVSSPIPIAGTNLKVGLSIGIALAPADGETPEQLVRHADIAMYQAKIDGGNTYRFFSADMNTRIAERLALEADLRRAIDAEEFVLHFQPRYSTASMQLLGVEALLRWKHPTRGLLQPSEFITLAEETGLIVPLGEWVLRRACAAASAFRDLIVSVNVSPTQFRSPALVDRVKRTLEESGMSGDRLELEVTESILLEDTDAARAVMHRLKALGVGLAMDDFGTGYSSLSYLSRFPFDRLKIDRQFIANLHATGEARAIVQAIIGLGRALGLDVTAEGVETPEQLLLLRADRCDEVQGYYLSIPEPEERLGEILGRPPDLKVVALAG